MNENDADIIEQLILAGGIELVSIDSNGEPLYRFTEKLQEIFPALYDEHLSQVNKIIMSLWEKGYVEMDLFSDNPEVFLTKKGKTATKFDDLSEDEVGYVMEIRRIYVE